jgi:hypothetical protein
MLSSAAWRHAQEHKQVHALLNTEMALQLRRLMSSNKEGSKHDSKKMINNAVPLKYTSSASNKVSPAQRPVGNSHNGNSGGAWNHNGGRWSTGGGSRNNGNNCWSNGGAWNNGGAWTAANIAGTIVGAVQTGVNLGASLAAPVVNGIASNIPLLVPSVAGLCMKGQPVQPFPNSDQILCLVGSGSQVTNFMFNAGSQLVNVAGNVAGTILGRHK